MTNKGKAHTFATIGTILFLVLLFLLLWFVYISAPKDIDEEGVEVAFGEVEDAGGYEAEESEAVPMPTEAATPVPPAPSNNDLITQEDEAALALQRQREKEQREQKAREEAERIAREKALAEQKAKEAEAIAKANAMGSLFGNSGNANGSGDGQGDGQKGNPVGHGSVGGNSWSLEGRGIRGNFPIPEKGQYVPGTVVIEIRVNPQGQVVSAREVRGNVSDRATIEAMLKKAREVQFTSTDKIKQDQVGYITYKIPD